MTRTARPPTRSIAKVRPVTGAAAERARLAEADTGTRPWRAWRVLVREGVLVVEDAGRRVSLEVAVRVDGRPTPVVAEEATPTGSHLRALAGPMTIEVARRAPRDCLIRAVTHDTGTTKPDLDVVVTLRAGAAAPGEPAPRPRVPWETTGPIPDSTFVRLDLPGALPLWLVSAQPLQVDPAPQGGEPSADASLRLVHHVEAGATAGTEIRLRLAASGAPQAPVGPDADATLATRARESSAFLREAYPAGMRGASTARRLAAEVLAHAAPSRLAAALDAVALATIDPSRARAVLLDSLAAWAHDAEAPTDGPGTAPLEAWATLRVHDLTRRCAGRADPTFLEEACSRLLTATAWWVDRVDPDGRNALHGGLPALDGPRVLPRGVVDHGPGLAHADGAAWLAVHTVSMLGLASTIASLDRSYEDMAVTFLDTIVSMIDALDTVGGGLGMWDPDRGAYLDVARATDGTFRRIPLRSLMSLVPLLGVTVVPGETLERLPLLAERVDGLLAERPELSGSIIRGRSGRRDRGDVLVSLVSRSRLGWALEHVLDPEGFLSPFGIRTLSRAHLAHPVHVDLGGAAADVRYRPAGARDHDGAALWQGQVSVTLTCLIADALRAHGAMRGSPLALQHPTGSGRTLLADEVADELTGRVLRALTRLARPEGSSLVGVDALDAEAGGPARPRGAPGRSSLPLAFLALRRHPS